MYVSDCTDEGLALFGVERDSEDLEDTTWMQSVKERFQNVDEEVVIDTPHDWREFYNASHIIYRGDFFAAQDRIGDFAMAL